jgi:hypothetical protein
VLGEVDALKSFRGDIEGESRQAVIHGERATEKLALGAGRVRGSPSVFWQWDIK